MSEYKFLILKNKQTSKKIYVCTKNTKKQKKLKKKNNKVAIHEKNILERLFTN